MGKIINLNKKFTVILKPITPYNFDATIHKPSHFPSSDNLWEKGKYWITMIWKGDVFGVKLEERGTIANPRIKLSVYSKRPIKKKTRDEIIPEIEWRFNIKSDIVEFCKKFKNDKYLKEPLRKWKGMKPVAANSFYETLIIYIVLQNATVRRTVQMLENLFSNFGQKVKFDGKILSAFWEPGKLAKVSEQKLRDLKLGYRSKFIKKINSQFSKGEIDEFAMRKMSKDEVREEALKLYGIGPASVEYLLFEDFYHYDALDTVPPWEQKIMSRLLFNKKLAFHYVWEDIFWERKTQQINWLEKEIRL